jgi:spermidine synthase
MQGGEAAGACNRMKSLFADATLYVAQVPSYAAGFMTLGWGCRSPEPRRTGLDEIARRVAALDLDTRYYTPAIHLASFALPAYIDRLMR